MTDSSNGICDQAKEVYGSIKGMELLDQLTYYQLLKKLNEDHHHHHSACRESNPEIFALLRGLFRRILTHTDAQDI
jgi:hypothetical protein